MSFSSPYQGTGLTTAQTLSETDSIEAYLPASGLVEAVNLAYYLKRPLLIKGEPGCGKTKLARAVAWELYGGKYQKYYFEWHIKSTSKAMEGLYRYDHIGQLRDVHLMKADSDGKHPPKGPEDYVKLGPLGAAFQVEDQRPVVLIDEIDKADIDFPNDLLRELEESSYTVEEIDEAYAQGKGDLDLRYRKAKQAPFVIITSNDEKELPEAFLRRCVYYYIDFPSPEQLADIIGSHFPQLTEKALIETAIQQFMKLRNQSDLNKLPSTSELVDWFKLLTGMDQPLTQEDLQTHGLRFYQVLIKEGRNPQEYLTP